VRKREETDYPSAELRGIFRLNIWLHSDIDSKREESKNENTHSQIL
jgi:hypothetical protein